MQKSQRFLSDQRFDLPFYDSMIDFIAEEFQAYAQKFINPTNKIIKNWEVESAGGLVVQVNISNGDSVLLNTERTGYEDLIRRLATETQLQITLADNSTNYVEVEIYEITCAPDTIALWDTTANSGEGAEFTQTADTVIHQETRLVSNTIAFTGDSNKIPLASITTSGGSVSLITDSRSFLFEAEDFDFGSPRTDRDNITNLKEVFDSLTFAIKEMKGTSEWYDEVGDYTTFGLLERFNYYLVDGGTISWEQPTANELAWSADLKIIVPNRAYDYTISAGSLGSFADGEVAYVTLPDIGVTPGGPLTMQKVANGSYLIDSSNSRNYIIAYRSGTKVYFGNGWQAAELESGEEIELGDGITDAWLTATGLTDENDSTPPYSSNDFITPNTSFTQGISELDQRAKRPFDVSISGSTISIKGSEVQRTFDRVSKSTEKGLYTVVASSSIDVASGLGTGDMAEGATPTATTVPASEYVWMGLEKRADDKVHVIWGIPNAVAGSATYPVFGTASGTISIALVLLQDDGSGSGGTGAGGWNFNSPTASSDLISFIASGAGGGSGDANADLTRFQDRLNLSIYKYLTANISVVEENNLLDGGSSTTFDIASQSWKFGGATDLTSAQMLDNEYLGEGVELDGVELYALWVLSNIDTAATYQLSRDGGANWESMTMDRVGESDTYRGTHRFTGSKATGTVTIASNSFDGTSETTTITTTPITAADLDGTYFFTYDDVGSVGWWFDVDGDDSIIPSVGILEENGVAFTDETVDIQDAGASDVTLLPGAFNLEDAFYFGGIVQFGRISLTIATGGAGDYTVAWEYWNGSAWTALSGVTDNTTDLKTTGTNTVVFTVPGDWATKSEAGLPSALPATAYYYVRCRVDTGTTFTTAPIGSQAKLELLTAYTSISVANRGVRISNILTGDSDSVVATKIATNINGDTKYSASAVGDVVTAVDYQEAVRTNSVDGTSGLTIATTVEGSIRDAITVNGITLTEGTEWTRGGTINASALALANAIDQQVPDVRASANAAVVTIEAIEAGPNGNLIDLTETDDGTDNFTLSGATLSGGHTLNDITEYAVANADATTEINITNVEEISQKFTISSTTTFENVISYISKTGAPLGKVKFKIVKDDTGAPSTDPSDVVFESSGVDVTTLSAGNNTVQVDGKYVLIAGDYHLIIFTDQEYKDNFSAGVNSISARKDSSSGPTPNLRTYNGTAWSAEVTNETLVYRLEGRVQDLRVRVNSSGADFELRSYGIYYSEESQAVDLNDEKFRQVFTFSGDDNTDTFTLTNFTPDPILLNVYALGTGQTFRFGDWTLDGQKVVFPANTFNLPGETITLEFLQIRGNVLVDSSDNNRNLLADNHLGSKDSSIDMSVAGRGVILRTPNSSLVELSINDNYEIEINLIT